MRYTVESVIAYDEATAPAQDIGGPTPEESITRITCAGSFDPNNRFYDTRASWYAAARAAGDRQVARRGLKYDSPPQD